MNSKMFRRILSLLSVLTMLMSLLGVFPVMAEEGMTELEEMALIKERFAAYYVENASPSNYADKTQYETYLNTIK